MRPVLPIIKGMAHITGGGLVENIPRILPDGTSAHLDSSTWRVPPIFTLLQERALIASEEMYRVFNMGIGMTLICNPSDADAILATIQTAEVIGEVSPDTNGERVSIS